MDLTTWETNVQALLRSRQPGIVITSVEESRVLASIIKVLQWMAEKGLNVRRLLRWSAVSVLEINILKPAEPVKNPPSRMELFAMLDYFVSPEQRETDESLNTGGFIRREALILADLGPFMNDALCVRKLREVLAKCRGSQQVVFIIGTPFQIPAELAPELAMMPYELPSALELEKSLAPVVTAYKNAKAFAKIKIDESVIKPLARATAGLTDQEARGVLGLSIAKFECLDARAVDLALTEKSNVIKRGGILEYRVCSGSLDDVGGLEVLKAYIKEQDAILAEADAAAGYGLKMPSGILMAGLPGVGKSLVAQCLASHWKLPLLVFDMGKIFNSLVGATEKNLDMVIEMATAVRPCVLWMDECEKALGSGSAENDGGTASRVVGKLLTFMAEKPEGIYIAATCNDISAFEKRPELLRAGRFDAIFALDLPDMRSRLEIFGIHFLKAIKRAKASGKCLLAEHVDPGLLMAAAKASKGFSGAEIECSVQTAIRAAFNAKPRLAMPTAEMLLQAVKRQIPLSVSMAEPMQRLRQWAASGRARAAGATLESDEKDVQALEELGLPDLLSESKV